MLGLGSSLFHPAEAEKFSFTNVDGLKLWLRPGSTLDSTGASWRDSSGHENNATQATSGDQAEVIASNGFANGGLDFEQSEGDHYDLGSAINVAVNTGWCVAGAVKIESYDSTQNCILSSASNKFFEWQTDDKIRINYTNTVTTLIPESANNNLFAAGSLFTFVVARNDSGVHTLYRNGSQLSLDSSSLNPTNTVASSFDAIGQREKTGPDRQFDGILYELAIWDAEVASRHIDNINEDLARRYGTL